MVSGPQRRNPDGNVSRTPIVTHDSPRPKAPIAQAVRTGNLLFVSGITPFTLDLRLAKGDFDAQMRQTMENVGAILRAAGSDFAHVVKCTVILARRDDWPTMNEIYQSYWPSRRFPGAHRLRGAPAASRLSGRGRMRGGGPLMLGLLSLTQVPGE